ncbi:MAG TPA: hypothetical protein VGQ85_09190, partial [Candidatus Limnocylindrales bacterium]|nr:hypothetical protein [Candidatus Limnocylindrales bacterium]
MDLVGLAGVRARVRSLRKSGAYAEARTFLTAECERLEKTGPPSQLAERLLDLGRSEEDFGEYTA